MGKSIGYVWTDSRGQTHHTGWGYHMTEAAKHLEKQGRLPSNWERAETWLGKRVPRELLPSGIPANARVEVYRTGGGGLGRSEAYGPETRKRLAESGRLSQEHVASRAAQISRENPALSNEEARAAALAEKTYSLKVPSGGGEESTETARILAALNRFGREMTPEQAIERLPKWLNKRQQKAFERAMAPLEPYASDVKLTPAQKRALGMFAYGGTAMAGPAAGIGIKKLGESYEGRHYNITAAILAGVDDKVLHSAFGKETIDAEKGRIKQEQIQIAKDEAAAIEAMKPHWDYKGKEITSSERAKTIADYDARMDKLVKEGGLYSEEWYRLRHENPEYLMTRSAVEIHPIAVSLVPVYGTIKNWRDMSVPWQIVSVATDFITIGGLIIGIPGVGSKVLTTAGKLKYIGKPKRARAVTNAIRAGSRETLFAMKTRPQLKPLLKPYTQLMKVQAKYADDLLQYEDLQKMLKQYALGETRVEALRTLETLKANQQASKAKLFAAAKNYQNAAKGIAKFDDPLIAGEFNSLPQTLTRSTQQLVKRMVNPRTIKQIRGDLYTAQAELDALKAQYPTDPNKWIGTLGRVSEYQAELKLAELGDAAELTGQLAATREAIPILKRYLKEARRYNSPYVKDFEMALDTAIKQEAGLSKKIDDVIKIFDVEYGRGGRLGGGAGKAGGGKPLPTGGSGGERYPTVTTLVEYPDLPTKMLDGKDFDIIWMYPWKRRGATPLAQLILGQALATAGTKVITKPRPKIEPWVPLEPDNPLEDKPYPLIVPRPRIITKGGPERRAYPDMRQAAMTSLIVQGITGTTKTTSTGQSIANRLGISPGQAPATAPAAALSASTRAQLREALQEKVTTQTTTPTITPTTVPVITTTKTPPPPVKSEDAIPRDKDATRREAFRGSVGWKQGLFIHAFKHPYQSGDDYSTFSVDSPPPNMQLVDGPGSAYKTIQVLTGRPPSKELHIDMGVQDVAIGPGPGKRGVKISFEPDPEQKTKGDITIGRETYHRGNIRIVETDENAVDRNNGKKETLKRRKARKSKVVDLGAGVVRTKRGQHLRLA